MKAFETLRHYPDANFQLYNSQASISLACQSNYDNKSLNKKSMDQIFTKTSISEVKHSTQNFGG